MKKSIFTLSLVFVALLSLNSVFAQVENTSTLGEEKTMAPIGGAEISFDKETHDYGQLEQHANGECVFVFTNTGTQPLKITKAKGSCGCTVPQWPKQPIPAGGSGEIQVQFDSSNKPGMQNKVVTITANTESKVKKLLIRAQVNPRS